jgi:hypothetical protein
MMEAINVPIEKKLAKVSVFTEDWQLDLQGRVGDVIDVTWKFTMADMRKSLWVGGKVQPFKKGAVVDLARVQ